MIIATFDGYGIAYAISEYIIKHKNCFTFFATHFHELTILERHHPSVVNKHVTAIMENGELIMLYDIQTGPCLQSFGVSVATSAGFPDTVIKEAKRKASELEGESSMSVEYKRKVQAAMAAFMSTDFHSLSDTNVVKVAASLTLPIES